MSRAVRAASRANLVSFPGVCRRNGWFSVGAPQLQFWSSVRTYSSSSVLDTEGHDISQQIDELSDTEYSRVADDYLETLSDELDVIAEDYEQLDFELSHGVLNITIPPNGSYVINKQPPNKQIWLSSPISGPKRFDLVGGKWTYLRDGTHLSGLLAGELGDAVGTDIVFEAVEQ